MTAVDPRALIRVHLERHPDRAYAYHDDATYRAQMEWLESLLRLVDDAMDAQGVGYRSRSTILREVVIGVASAEAAQARRAEHVRRVEELMHGRSRISMETTVGRISPEVFNLLTGRSDRPGSTDAAD